MYWRGTVCHVGLAEGGTLGVCAVGREGERGMGRAGVATNGWHGVSARMCTAVVGGVVWSAGGACLPYGLRHIWKGGVGTRGCGVAKFP